MTLGRVPRAFAFLGVASLAVVLVSTAVTGTGAYFTDSAAGGVSATMGSIGINATDVQMTFTDVLPGETRVGATTFTNDGSNPTDVWLVFDAAALVTAQQAGTVVTFAITGSNPTTPQTGPLGSLEKQYLVHSSLAPSGSGRVGVSFAISPTLTAGQGAVVSLPFKIVATQVGITPDNVNNPST